MNDVHNSSTKSERKKSLLGLFITTFHVVRISVFVFGPAYAFYLMSDTRGRTDWVVPELKYAQKITGTLVGKSWHKWPIRVKKSDGSIIYLGCTPNFKFNSCLDYNKEWIDNKSILDFYYFRYEKSKYYKNVILKIEKDGLEILSYGAQIKRIERDRKSSEREAENPYFISIVWLIFCGIWISCHWDRSDANIYQRLKEKSSSKGK